MGGVDTWLQEIEVWRWLMGEVSGESTGAAGALRFKCSSAAGPQVTAAHEEVLTD